MAEKKTPTVAESNDVDNVSEIEALRKQLKEANAELAKRNAVEAQKQAVIDAEAARNKTMDEMLAADAEAQKAKMNERVPVYLIKDTNEYKNDREVCWNGKIYVLKRGMQLTVPRGVEQILKSSAHQDFLTLTRMEAAANIDLGER